MTDKLALRPGEKLTIEAKLSYLTEIAETMENSEVSKTDIMKRYNVSWPTATAWHNEAMMLIVKQDNGLSRDGKRAIHEGQINRRLGELFTDLQIAGELDDKLKIHDRIVKYLDARARVTGLNSEVQLNLHAQVQPLTIVRSKPMSHNVVIEQPTDGDDGVSPSPTT